LQVIKDVALSSTTTTTRIYSSIYNAISRIKLYFEIAIDLPQLNLLDASERVISGDRSNRDNEIPHA